MHRHFTLASACLLATLSIAACRGRDRNNADTAGSASGILPGPPPNTADTMMNPNSAAPNTTMTPAPGAIPGAMSPDTSMKMDTGKMKMDSGKKHGSKR